MSRIVVRGLLLVAALLFPSTSWALFTEAYLFSGSPLPPPFFAGEELGSAVNGVGDVNGDGFDDVIIGAPRFVSGPHYRGRVIVVSGFNGAILYHIVGPSPNGWFGQAVNGAGDVNGDGKDDFIVGAHRTSSLAVGQHIGEFFVFSGADGSILHHEVGTSAQLNLGISVGSAGDVNRDGFDDFLVGATGFGGAGGAFVYSGFDGSVIYTPMLHCDFGLERSDSVLARARAHQLPPCSSSPILTECELRSGRIRLRATAPGPL